MTHIIDNISDELFRRKNALVGETLRLQCKCYGNDKKRIVTICQFRRYFDRTAITPTTTKSTTGNNLLRVSSIWGNKLIHGFILQQSNVDRDVLFIRQMLTQVGFDVSSFAFPFVSKRVKCVIDLNLVFMNDFVNGLLDCVFSFFLKILNKEKFKHFCRECHWTDI